VNYDFINMIGDTDQGAGSAIHIGNGWMLTADHVGNRNGVTFDGVNYYRRDVSVPYTQVAINVDAKLFKLETTPFATATLYDGTLGSVSGATSTLIGWGRGRAGSDPAVGNPIPLGDASTIDKRWGQNEAALENFAYVDPTYGYTYQSLVTVLGDPNYTPASERGVGSLEASANFQDSGSGLFQQIGADWYLVGLTTSVEFVSISGSGSGVLYASDDPATLDRGNVNYFFEIEEYEETIMGLVPEVSAFSLYCAVWVLAATGLRRKRRD
jgi:hypothetical protein